jgi:hypothetical protein
MAHDDNGNGNGSDHGLPYSLNFSHVDRDSPEYKRFQKRISKLGEQLWQDMLKAHTKYARAVGALRDAQKNEKDSRHVDSHGFELGTSRLGQMFAMVAAASCTPNYVRAMFDSILDQELDCRRHDQLRAQMASMVNQVTNAIDETLIRQAAAKHPDN